MATDRGPTLLAIARGAIAEQLGLERPPFEPAPWLLEPGATFVTLTSQGLLRGCIGTLVARRPLRDDVESNARSAAFHDSRFPPLSPEEFDHTDLEVSLLSPLEPVPFESREHLLSLLRPGVDGVVLEWRGRKGAFLPQVWDQQPDPEGFLAHLNQKAGLSLDFWNDEARFSRFTVTRFQGEKARDGAHV
ncbi:MAG TPA: AmmeMemoRadiSam system protein A [Geothrix sp.]|jgi:hypothetical protein